MAEVKRFYKSGLTGFGTLVYPKIVNPDTKGKFADGKYKTELVLTDKKEADAFLRHIQKVAEEAFGTDEVMLPVRKTKTGKIKKDDDGNIVFKFKSSKKPMITDAKRKPLPKGVDVRGGSRARIAYTLTNYDDGLSMWVDAVQIIELVSGSPGASAFDEVEGFDASELDESAYTLSDDAGEGEKSSDDDGDDDAEESEDGSDRFAL